jgi:apolipoprotein N-acyltransferase
LTYEEIARRKQNGKSLPDLIVFPETVCNISVLEFEGSVKPADIGLTDEESMQWKRVFQDFADQIETPILLGLSTYTFRNNPENPIRLNSALYVSTTSAASCLLPPAAFSRYDKMHLVLFGEYIPFTEYLPDNFILKTVCPEAEHGDTPVAIPIGAERRQTADGRRQQIQASINICFESSVAHLIRSQVLALRKAGHDPRVLINLSNDGWFRFSQAMEQHLATHVFRAVENGMYYITATNGGYSAIIDPYGNIVAIGKRGEAEAVSGTIYVKLDEPHPLTIYQRYGDGYALPLALGVLFLAGVAFWERRK